MVVVEDLDHAGEHAILRQVLSALVAIHFGINPLCKFADTEFSRNDKRHA
jgi:hypothetical protein